MPSLMTIPRELRDQICNYAILASHIERPSLDQTFEELVEGRIAYQRPALETWSAVVLYQPQGMISNASKLLLVNRQLNAEVQENLKRVSVTYDLDVIILDEVVPLATWTRVPVLTTKIEQVNATFRISGSYHADKSKPRRDRKDGTPTSAYARIGHYIGWRGGDGGFPAIYWQVYSLLERFIRVGPLGERGNVNEHQHFTAKTLNINVETPPGIDPSRFGPPVEERDWDQSLKADSILNPAYLANLLHRLVDGLIRHNDREWFSYGQVLYEHVDEVVLCKDGVEVYRADVAERLRDIDGINERYVSKEQLRDYKERTWRERKERGLKVLPME